MASIFDRVRLTPQQMRTVADRRFEDARYLRQSRQNKHANAVYYFGGVSLECVLKAKLLEAYPELERRPGPGAHASPDHLYRFNLCYRWHDLEALVDALPSVHHRLTHADPSGSLSASLSSITATWNVFARYSPPTPLK